MNSQIWETSDDPVTSYALRVAAGEVPCGRLHRLACDRHLRDLDRQGTEEFPYEWRPEASNRALRYASKLTILEGFNPKPLRLYPFQTFDVGCTFGWYNRYGYRRFRARYKCVSRQHGKSMEQGILGTYIAGWGGYRHGQLFTAATKKRQAKIVWKEMAKFIEANKSLEKKFEVKEYKSLITARATKCTIEALSKEAGLDDGFRPVFASIDELHQMRDNSVFKALQNGSRWLDETLISMITTRGFDLESFAYEMDTMAVRILEGTVSKEDMFCDIFCLDEGDDPFDEANWIKANPILATTERGMEQIRSEAAQAQAMGGGELRDFLTKCMNIWVKKTDDTFISPDDLKRARSARTLEDFRGERCWAGIDLSHGGDLTTIALEFELGDGGAYLWSHSFMPRGRLSEHIDTDLAPYDLWHSQGLITTTGGESDYRIDYKAIVVELDRVISEYELDLQGIGYDNHNADAFLEDLECYGVPLVKVTQSAQSLNDATVDVQLLAKSGKLEMDGANELMAWSFANAVLVTNSFGEVKIDKKPSKRQRRIDPVDASIDAHFARMVLREADPVDYDAEFAEYMRLMGLA